jgi:hypothetical protein
MVFPARSRVLFEAGPEEARQVSERTKARGYLLHRCFHRVAALNRVKPVRVLYLPGHGKKNHRRMALALDFGFDEAIGAGEDEPAAEGGGVEAADVPPRLPT